MTKCINKCKLDKETRVCVSCHRHIDEIKEAYNMKPRDFKEYPFRYGMGLRISKDIMNTCYAPLIERQFSDIGNQLSDEVSELSLNDKEYLEIKIMIEIDKKEH